MRVMAEHVAISGADTSVAQTLLLDRAKNEAATCIKVIKVLESLESDISQTSVAKVMSHIRCKRL